MRGLILCIIAYVLNFIFLVSFAAGQMKWVANGLPVCQTGGEQNNVSIITDHLGGAVVGWEDLRNSGDKELYAQRLSPSGSRLWTANGKPICVRSASQSKLRLVSGFQSRVFAAWEELGGTGSKPDIFVQSLDLDGNRLWGDTGVFIARDADWAPCYGPDLASDGSGGILVAWEDWVNRAGVMLDPYPSIFANRVDSTGVRLWGTGGKDLTGYSYRFGISRPVSVIEDGTGGGMYACWTNADSKTGGGLETIMIGRLDAAGTLQWLIYPGGGRTTSRKSPRIISDGGTGCIVTWYDRRSGNWDIYAQRVDQIGNLKWGSSGLQVSSSTRQEMYPQLCADGNSGAIICYYDSTAGDILAQRVDIFGNLRWGTGIQVCQAPQMQSEPQIASDDEGGCYIVWTDERNGLKDIYCQRYDSLSSAYYTLNGVPVCNAASDQMSPQICSDEAGGAICAWVDYRNGNADIYAQKIGGIFECGDMTFRPEPDGWQFSNSESNMWPQSWWRQFNYCQSPYPLMWCFLCDSQDFPDWNLFVSAFGQDKCYFNPPPGLVIYKPSAVARWFALKGSWGGSCFGFAISSFLFFDGFLSVPSEFPGNSTVYSVPIGDESRLMQNKYWIYQFGREQLHHINENFNSTTPNQTLISCQDMFKTSTRDDKILVLFNNHGSGGHAINPYRCDIDSLNPSLRYLYVYDNNFPNDFSKRVTINTLTNTWSYDGLPGWGGYKHLFLMDPASDYTINPQIPTSIPPRDRRISGKAGAGSEYIEFYCSVADSVRFESASGSIGHIGDSLFTTLSDGSPIIPLTGKETPPIGYYLPNSSWRCQFSGAKDSTFHLSLFTDSTVMVYWRRGANSSQKDNLSYSGNDSILLVDNRDNENRSYNIDVMCIASDSEVSYNLKDISTLGNDSTRVSIKPGSRLKVDNYGSARTYNIRIEIASPSDDTTFFHQDVPLNGNSSHEILPNWRQCNDSLMILIDSGMVGSFSDTMFVANVTEVLFIPGDVNGDGKKTVSDAVYLVNYLFKGGPPPVPLQAADCNCDGKVTVSDVVCLINYLFKGGPPPGC